MRRKTPFSEQHPYLAVFAPGNLKDFSKNKSVSPAEQSASSSRFCVSSRKRPDGLAALSRALGRRNGAATPEIAYSRIFETHSRRGSGGGSLLPSPPALHYYSSIFFALASRYFSASGLHSPLWRATILASSAIIGSVLPSSSISSSAVSGIDTWV